MGMKWAGHGQAHRHGHHLLIKTHFNLHSSRGATNHRSECYRSSSVGTYVLHRCRALNCKTSIPEWGKRDSIAISSVFAMLARRHMTAFSSASSYRHGRRLYSMYRCSEQRRYVRWLTCSYCFFLLFLFWNAATCIHAATVAMQWCAGMGSTPRFLRRSDISQLHEVKMKICWHAFPVWAPLLLLKCEIHKQMIILII
jgi:hypothetical protein